MKKLAIVLIVTLVSSSMPSLALAQRATGGMRAAGGGRGGGGQAAPRSAPNQGRGFNLSNDVPSTRSGGNRNGASPNNRPANTGANKQNPTKNNGSNNNKNASSNNNNKNASNNNNKNGSNNNNKNGSNNNNKNGSNNNNKNGNNNNNKNGNNNNNKNVNVSGNTVNVNKNYNGYNSYGYHGAVVVNPVYRGPAWGWNGGVVWAPVPTYWGGGFWGPFAVGAATAVVMGSIVRSNQTYSSYQVSSGSPGATLLSNYGLQQVQCGPPGLVVIYGPNNGVICANPNDRVAAGSYAVNENTLTLQSQ
jgi:hypothetical protein